MGTRERRSSFRFSNTTRLTRTAKSLVFVVNVPTRTVAPEFLWPLILTANTAEDAISPTSSTSPAKKNNVEMWGCFSEVQKVLKRLKLVQLGSFVESFTRPF